MRQSRQQGEWGITRPPENLDLHLFCKKRKIGWLGKLLKYAALFLLAVIFLEAISKTIF